MSTVLKVLLLIIMMIVLMSGVVKKMNENNVLSKFETEIIKGNIDKMSLTIYYMNPSSLTLYPLSAEDLINMSSEVGIYEDGVTKINVKDSALNENKELLKLINNNVLIPVDSKSRMNTRIYYVFKDQKGQKLFDVAMWGVTDSIYVNGREYEENDVFYEVILPFLPEFAVEELRAYLKLKNQN